MLSLLCGRFCNQSVIGITSDSHCCYRYQYNMDERSSCGLFISFDGRIAGANLSKYQFCNSGFHPEIFAQCNVRTYRRFSAIGGTIGSIITGFVFQEFSGQRAFYLSLIPLTLLIISAIFMNRLKIQTNKNKYRYEQSIIYQ